MVRTPTSLVVEKQDLMAAEQWIKQEDVTYAKVSIWPVLNHLGQFDTYRVQYVLKLQNQDLRKHSYKSQLAHRYNDYLSYIKALWFDWTTWTFNNKSKYQNFRDTAKLIQDMGEKSYLGRCSRVKAYKKDATNLNRAPNLAYTTAFLWYDVNESEWVFELYHHDFVMESRTHVNQWNQSIKAFINKYGIKQEFGKGTNPPAITSEWRV